MKISGTQEERKHQLENLMQHEDVEYIEPDYPIYTSETMTETDSDDPLFSKQWFHKTLNSLDAWQITNGSQEIVAAVIDTGIDYTHPDLQDNIWVNTTETLNGKDDDGNGYIDDIHGWNFADNTNDARTSKAAPHGTHVAGLIGATGHNQVGVVGVAPKVKLMALKFMDDKGAGLTSNAVRAINYAIDKKVFLVNNSWGSNKYSKTLEDAINRAAQAGIIVFAASGNGDKGIGYNIDEKPWYPSSYENWNLFSVAATDTHDQLTKFSNFSKNKIDVAAPGASIFSTATPIVAGLAVLIKSTNPNLNGEQVLRVIRESSDKLANLLEKVATGGRINSFNAVRLAHEVRDIPNCGRK